MKNGFTQYAHDAASSPTVVKAAATATTGLGLNEIFGWVESGIAFAATVVGLLVTIALWRKLRLERREAELRIRVLEQQLTRNDMDAPLD